LEQIDELKAEVKAAQCIPACNKRNTIIRFLFEIQKAANPFNLAIS
jgi:hypothetical protein